MTRMMGSVPLGRTRIRPVLPSSARAASTAWASSGEAATTATIGRFVRIPQPNALGDDPDGLNSPAAGRGNDDLFSDRDKDKDDEKDKKKGKDGGQPK